MVAPAPRSHYMVDSGGSLVKRIPSSMSTRAKDFSIDSLISRSQMTYSDDSCNESCCSEDPVMSPVEEEPLLSPLGKSHF